MINFNIPPFMGTEINYIKEAVANKKICGDGAFTKNVMHGWKKNLAHKKYY